MAQTKQKTRDAVLEAAVQLQETDGFHLVIDALKLNGIDTIFGLPGIPITDLTRRLQAQRSPARLLTVRAELYRALQSPLRISRRA